MMVSGEGGGKKKKSAAGGVRSVTQMRLTVRFLEALCIYKQKAIILVKHVIHSDCITHRAALSVILQQEMTSCLSCNSFVLISEMKPKASLVLMMMIFSVFVGWQQHTSSVVSLPFLCARNVNEIFRPVRLL